MWDCQFLVYQRLFYSTLCCLKKGYDFIESIDFRCEGWRTKFIFVFGIQDLLFDRYVHSYLIQRRNLHFLLISLRLIRNYMAVLQHRSLQHCLTGQHHYLRLFLDLETH